MATIREYFDTDVKALSVHTDWKYAAREGVELGTIRAKIAYDFEGNAKYWYIFLDEKISPFDGLITLLRTPEFLNCTLSTEGDGVQVQMGHADYSEKLDSSTFVFTSRVHLYLDHDTTIDDRRRLVDLGIQQGIFVSIRDKEYARERSKSEKPLAFISHDSRDKDDLVRELALQLIKVRCPVWYDEFSLKVGDSLRSSIEAGLKEASKCILILSPSFLSNDGWGKAEFDSVFTREILEKKNVILPVWHNVGVKDVYDYSPRLADKVGLNSNLGLEELARKLSNAARDKS